MIIDFRGDMNGRQFRRLRKSSGASQIEVSRRAVVDRVRVSLFENGHIELRPEETRALQRALVQIVERQFNQLGSWAKKLAKEPQD